MDRISLLLTGSASGVFFSYFFFQGIARICARHGDVAASTPRRLGYGDKSGRRFSIK
jgi:hypothetical protein